MWRRYLLGAVSMTVSVAIMDWLNHIPDARRRAETGAMLQDLKLYLASSSNSTRRAIASLIP